MDGEQLAVKLQETTDRSLRNEGRIKKLESEHEVLQKLATSVAVMAEQIKVMNNSVKDLTNKVDEMESKPAKQWENVSEKIILTIVAAVVGFILAQIGLM